jgi:hypothetical protein
MAKLTPEEIKREQERLRLIQEQNEAAKDLLSTYEKQKKVTGALTDDEKDILNLTRDLNNLSKELESSTQKRLSGTSSLKDLEDQLKKLKKENINFEDNAVKLSQAKLQAQQKAQQLDNIRIEKANNLQALQGTLETELQAQRQIARELAELAGSRNQADRDRINILKSERDLSNIIIKEAKEEIDKKEKEVELAKKRADEQYNLAEQINKTIKANEKTKEQLAEELALLQQAVKIKKQEEVLNTLKEKFNTKQITDLLTISGITKAIVDGMFQFDKTSVAISKNIGYGATQANVMAAKMQLTSVFSNATNLTMKNMTEAMGQLNTATGFVADYSKDTLETQIMLTKQFGLTGEEASGIYKLSVLTGKSSEKVNDEMVGAFVAARNASKAGIPFKESIATAAKVSGQLKANLQADPAGIVKAVVATTALGTSLEQTAAQGEKLLNFASSIESELNAELLTGKQLNLERARAAALAGDQVALAEELNKNIGSYEDFTKMNVLQQKALADAVGLTADQLANQLEKQKLAREAGKSLAEFTKDEALEAQKRKEIQQKFNDIVEKLQNLIGTIGALFAPIIQGITFLADNAFVLYTTLGLIALSRLPAIAKGFKGMGDSVKETALNAKKLFSKEGRSELFGGADKAKETITSSRGLTLTKKDKAGDLVDKAKGSADKASGAGEKVGEGGPGAGDGIKNTLTGISDGIKSFRDVKLTDILKLAGSALALVALTPAIPALLLLQLVNGKLIQSALTGLGEGLAALGKALSGGQVILGIAVLTGAMIGLGYALNLAAPGIEAFGKAIKSTFEGIGAIITSAANGIATIFGSLQNVDVMKLLAIGPALIGIGVGLASLGAGGVIGAIGAFLGGDPIEKLQALAASGDGLTQTATALQAIAGALIGVSAALASIDVSKLEALDEFSSTQATNSAVKGITDFITAPIKAIGESIGGGGKEEINAGIDLTPMISAINEVRTAIDRLYNKDTSINMDGKKVGNTLVQGSYKVA